MREKFKKIVDSLERFKNLYDVIRIVDPVEKHSFTTKQKEILDLEEQTCYNFWQIGTECDQCIGMKAYTENDAFFKIENKGEKIFLFTACPYTEEDGSTLIVEIIKDITKNGSIVIEKSSESLVLKEYLKEINQQAMVDELTGLYNKRYINKMLLIDINRSKLLGYPMCLIMADLDFFKQVNDTYGHDIGDKVLRDFADILKGAIRKGNDWAARYGGEEFLIVANNTDLEGGFKLAEKIRQLVEEKVFDYDDVKIKITASFGVHCIKSTEMGIEKFIEVADQNLYKAKRSGRNKTVGGMA